MSYNLFLDDIREPYVVGNYMYPVELRSQYRLEKWEICRNYTDFVMCIQQHGLPNKVSFDHDLADIHYQVPFEDWNLDPSINELHEETGLDCAKFLCFYCEKHKLKLPECFVHSANPIGKENIIKYLDNFKKHN